jgi:hypothetical protein
MRTINAGALIHTVLIQQRNTETLDDSGAPDETAGWTTLVSAQMGRIDRRSERGGETFKADQVSALMTTRWTMRYLASMDPDLVDVQKTRRLLYQGRSYDIIDAGVLDRRAGIELRTIAKSRVAA